MSTSPTFYFEMVTPERVVYAEQVRRVTLPSKNGEITVLSNHEPLVSLLDSGELIAERADGTIDLLAVSGGMIKVAHNTLTILADAADFAHEINEAEAEAARMRAEKLLTEKRIDAESYAELSTSLARQLARLKVAKKYRNRSFSNTQGKESV